MVDIGEAVMHEQDVRCKPWNTLFSTFSTYPKRLFVARFSGERVSRRNVHVRGVEIEGQQGFTHILYMLKGLR